MLLKWNSQNTKEFKEAKNMIADISSMKGWKKTCFEGLPFKNGFPQHLEKGVRPVIIIDAEKIKNILKNK